jgi:hypothetical protein
MGTHYISYCPKCKLAIDDGKDSFSLRHELFKLYHNHRYPDHEIERYNDDAWIDKWLNEASEPEQLYDEQSGYLISIPEWLDELIDAGTESWIKNNSKNGVEFAKYQVPWDTIESVFVYAVRDNRVWIATLQDNKILKYGTERNPQSEA